MNMKPLNDDNPSRNPEDWYLSVEDLYRVLQDALVSADTIESLQLERGSYWEKITRVFPVMMKADEQACRATLRGLLLDSQNQRFAIDARNWIAALPREWVLSHIEKIADRVVDYQDDTDCCLLWSLYEMLSPDLVERLRARGCID